MSISSSTEARWSGSRIRQNSTNSHRSSEKYFLGIVGGSSIATYCSISNGAISGWSNWSGGRGAWFSHPAGGRDIETSIWWSVSGGIGYFPIAISIREIPKLQRSLLRVYSEPRCENMISTTTTTTTTTHTYQSFRCHIGSCTHEGVSDPFCVQQLLADSEITQLHFSQTVE